MIFPAVRPFIITITAHGIGVNPRSFGNSIGQIIKSIPGKAGNIIGKGFEVVISYLL